MGIGFYQPDLEIEYIEYSKKRAEQLKGHYTKTKLGHYQIIFVMSGQFSVKTINTSVELNAGEFTIAPPNTYLMYYRLTDKAESLVIHFQSSVLHSDYSTELLNAFNQLPPNTVFKPSEFDSKICSTILYDFKNALINRLSRVYIANRLKTVLCEIDIEFKKKYDIALYDTKNVSVELIEYVNKHFTQPLTLKSIKEKFFISESSINRIFKTMCDMTFTSYLNNVRIHNVKNLVNDKHISISKAAEMSGYSTYSTFYRAYKKLYDHAPTTTALFNEKYYFPFANDN